MVPVFKRALTFVFLVRYALGFKSQMQWKKFTAEDYKLNRRCFKRWGNLEAHVFNHSEQYLKLPDHVDDPSPRKKRKPLDSATETESPMKRVYKVDSDSTDEE